MTDQNLNPSAVEAAAPTRDEAAPVDGVAEQVDTSQETVAEEAFLTDEPVSDTVSRGVAPEEEPVADPTESPLEAAADAPVAEASDAPVEETPETPVEEAADIDFTPADEPAPPVAAAATFASVEPEPAAQEPTPVAVKPTPVAVKPTPVAVKPTPVAVEPTPVVVEPMPVAMEMMPAPEAAGDGTDQAGDDYSRTFTSLNEGDVVQGVVVHIDREGVLVDVGTKSEGIIRRNELSRDPSIPAEDIVKVGEIISVYVLEAENQDGNLILSKKRADFEKAWDRVQEAKEQGKTLFAMVSDRVKGGLVVDLGIRGFVPASHVGNGSMKNNLERYVGQSIPLKVIEVDKERRKVVLSNKLAVEEERQTKKAETVGSLQPGQVRRGVVRRLTNYGAFIDLGGIDGLLHISEMSWTRINHPQEVLREGQEIDVVVLKMDLEAGRVSLGLRQILPDPWTGIDARYHVGDTIVGAVTRVVPFGVFVQVEGGIEGIIPNSELSSRKGGKQGGIQQGQDVEVKVIDLRPDERKMTLSLRQLQQEPEVKRERRDVEEYQPRTNERSNERSDAAPRFTIGDALRAKEEAEAAEEDEE